MTNEIVEEMDNKPDYSDWTLEELDTLPRIDQILERPNSDRCFSREVELIQIAVIKLLRQNDK
jgi:hypothetical protein